MVREALFSILGDAIPGQPFIDLFAGTGANGLEALSRGASTVFFVERDVRLANEIERHLRDFGVGGGHIVRTDAYRWAERWEAPAEPVNVFVSPPFPDFERRPDALVRLLSELQRKVAADSVLVLQGERGLFVDQLPSGAEWEERRYGRNLLLIWVKENADGAPDPADPN
jgi:16S rRNA (guanine(966)-N(2))-methyltransferase RsmD